MEKIRFVAQAVVDNVNSEESMIINAFGKWTDWLFKWILFLGIPFFLYVISQFIQLD